MFFCVHSIVTTLIHAMTDPKRLTRYVVFDYVSAFAAWLMFNVFRFYTFKHTVGFSSLDSFIMQDKGLWMSVLLPLFWVLIYYLSGYYSNPRRKTVLGDLLNSAFNTLIGVIVLFFLVIIDDYPEHPFLYYEIILGFLLIHFAFTALFRLIQTGKMVVNQSKGLDCIPVLVVGTGLLAKQLKQEFNSHNSSFCYRLEGFVRVGKVDSQIDSKEILGEMSDFEALLKAHPVEELIFALDDVQPNTTVNLLKSVYKYGLPVKAYANRQDVLAGKVSLFSLFGIPLYSLTPMLMPVWQKNLKAILDRIFSVLLLLFCFPLFAYLALRVRMDSKGPVFYSQKRVGKGGKLFHIYKFRTMYLGAEPDGPMLSSKEDVRITRFGRFMRKYRLDELPQFWNVLKGDMSMVGPRPEREHFVTIIVQEAPQYYLSQLVLPGITSWGMVKFGYADTIEKMVNRLEYDIIYLENQSLLIDLKILVFTLKPLLSGKGQ